MDVLEDVAAIDKSGMLHAQLSMPEASVDALELARLFLDREGVARCLEDKPKCIIVSGMGGSAIGGEIVRDRFLDEVKIPIFVSRGYNLPAFADRESLVFVVSYSGSTDETLGSFEDGLAKGCRMLGITSGNELHRLCLSHGVPCLRIPEAVAPRAALPYLFFPVLAAVQRVSLRDSLGPEISEALDVMNGLRDDTRIEVPSPTNPAKQLAKELVGKIPVIYAESRYSAAALRMKTQFNENSKIPAYSAVYPEAFHNDIVGYESKSDLSSVLSLLLLRDQDEDRRIGARIEALKSILLDRVHSAKEIWTRGESRLAKVLSLVYLGDVTSTYLALLCGIDPTPTESISRMKRVRENHL